MKNIAALSSKQKALTTAIVAVIIAIAVVVIVFLPGFIGDINKKRVREAVDVVAASQVAVLNAQIEQLQQSLVVPAKEVGVVSALQQADSGSLESMAEQMQSSSASLGVVRMRLIPANGDYSSMGLRFSQLERLAVVQKGAVIYPEAFNENGKMLFDVLIPIKDEEGKIYGYILAVVDSQVFEKSFNQVDVAIAETVLQQKFNNGITQTIFRSGKGTGLEQASDPVVSVVPHWRVVVVPGPRLLEENTISSLWQFSVQGLALLACFFALYLVNKQAAVVVKKAEVEHTTPIQIKGARKIDRSDAANIPSERVLENDDLADPLFQVGDVFDLDLDDDVPEVRASSPKTSQLSKAAMGNDNFATPSAIFRDYDIRGNADSDISDELAIRIGQAFGSECIEKGQENVVLAGDGRTSTPRLKYAVQQGLQAAGCNVIDVGIVPTPLMNFAANTLTGVKSGIMVTASHNQASDNGFKMLINGHTLASDEIQNIRERVQTGSFCEGEGGYQEQDIIDEYIEHIISDIVLAGSYKVVVDCGNGIAGVVAPRLLEELGCDVVQLHCDVDGDFPNHAPDPSVLENLNDLIDAVKQEGADLGVAFDGDGDRLAVVTASGEIILPDCLLMLFARDVVSRNPGTDIVFDVKSTRRLNALISGCGGRPVMWKSGHSHIKNKMLETGAMLGGELSGHIFFKERWFGFDDGMYSVARLLEIMSIRDQDLDSIFAALPTAACTPEIRIPVLEDEKFSIVKSLAENGEWGNGKVTSIDGVRVDFAKGWGLVRASNTSAALTLRFEADDNDSLATVQHVFKQQLQLVNSELRLPF
ncbi:MAG TPA: phosphomannomutase/phosphoglucomutase [Pseudomonadales bacterium]|nr:phosphomannomutase/phosphoglucomutase [Pseudomonadales bacterium]